MDRVSRTVAIATLGCKTNQFESAAMEERLKEAGFEVIPFEAGAALVIVNTCTVTAATDSQSRNLIRRARRINPVCRVVVTGCYAQVDPEALRRIPGVAVVLGNAEKKDFLRYLETEGSEPLVSVSDIATEKEAVPLSLTTFSERSRAFLQIQNGCDAYCSYCIIPYSRGRSRSVLPDEILVQVRTLADSGYPEVVLTGIHIGGYGTDLSPSTSLLDLVQRIEAETSVLRLRLGSVEPTEIPDQLIEQMADSTILCPHFHIPLQAGSDEVLRRMNRHYDTRFFRQLIERIHGRIPDAAIGLDLITGFPGETEAEFSSTLRLIEELPISHLHVFPFSRRPGTPAASMPDQLPGDLIKARAAQLREVGAQKHRRFAGRFIGTVLDLVVEGGGDHGRCRGISPNYLAVRFAGGEELQGQRVAVKITGWADGILSGELA
jgi:threonylcarbamoyladenosine tRNA methylthiotransferase MtaB